MNKPKHNWEFVSINPELNGVDPDTNEWRKYFDIWTRFQQCTNCGRVEEVDRDATHIPEDGDGDEYMYDGWFVTHPGDTDKCEQEVTIGYHIYYVEGKGWDKRVEMHNSPGHYSADKFIPPFTQEEFLGDLVTQDVSNAYWRKRNGNN
jgi:hypothetical protein